MERDVKGIFGRVIFRELKFHKNIVKILVLKGKSFCLGSVVLSKSGGVKWLMKLKAQLFLIMMTSSVFM